MADSRAFYTANVWPLVADDLKAALSQNYPNVRLRAKAGCVSLADLPVTMLVGLTGTGKSTTLDQLNKLRKAGGLTYRDDIPDRRELADLVIIPTAQVIGSEAVQPVKDREKRFELTRRFAQAFDAGGSAAAYGWLYYCQDTPVPLLSDGLRGPGEIAYTLAHYPQWQVIELWVDPVLRLRRLSHRNDAFDQVARAAAVDDLGFLPDTAQTAALQLLEAGEISPQAIITARAEAQNYGGQPYDALNQTGRYHCLVMDHLPPDAVAQQVAQWIAER
jgi:hypothetical protein